MMKQEIEFTQSSFEPIHRREELSYVTEDENVYGC